MLRNRYALYICYSSGVLMYDTLSLLSANGCAPVVGYINASSTQSMGNLTELGPQPVLKKLHYHIPTSLLLRPPLYIGNRAGVLLNPHAKLILDHIPQNWNLILSGLSC